MIERYNRKEKKTDPIFDTDKGGRGLTNMMTFILWYRSNTKRVAW